MCGLCLIDSFLIASWSDSGIRSALLRIRMWGLAPPTTSRNVRFLPLKGILASWTCTNRVIKWCPRKRTEGFGNWPPKHNQRPWFFSAWISSPCVPKWWGKHNYKLLSILVHVPWEPVVTCIVWKAKALSERPPCQLSPGLLAHLWKICSKSVLSRRAVCWVHPRCSSVGWMLWNAAKLWRRAAPVWEAFL